MREREEGINSSIVIYVETYFVFVMGITFYVYLF